MTGYGKGGEGKGGQALGAVQAAFGAAEKGYDKMFDAMAATSECEAEFGDVLSKMPAKKKKLLNIEMMIPLAREKVLNEAAATSAKRKGILEGYRGKAAGKGIPWKDSIEKLSSRGLDVWEKERSACSDPNLVYPAYWAVAGKGTIHSYDAGNCCWEAAFDLPMGAYELVHAHHFPDVKPQECFCKLHRTLDDATIDAVKGAPAKVVVDIGCGAGTSTYSMRETLNTRGMQDAHLTGLDLSDYFIAVANYRMNEGDKKDLNNNLKFIHGNGLRLANKDGEVDIFMASALTHELPKQSSKELIAEAARVLRTGGAFGYFDLNPVQLLRDNPVSNLVDRVAISNEPFMAEFLDFDIEEALKANEFELVEIRSTNTEKWPNWEDCPCRIVIARKL